MAGFSDLFRKVTSLFGSQGGSVVGIDVGSSSIKVVQLKEEKGAIVLETYGELALGPYAELPVGAVTSLPTDKLAQAIKDVCQQAKVTARRAYFSLPSRGTLAFVVSLPPDTREADLPNIVPNEARRFIPVPITEVSLDWFMVPQKDTYGDEASGVRHPVEVLVVAVQNDTLQTFQKLMGESGFDVAGYELELFSSVRSVLGGELTPVLIADCGAASTRMAVVEYGVVRAFNVVNRGSTFLTETLARASQIPFDRAEDEKHKTGIVDPKSPMSSAVLIIAQEMRNLISQYERTQNRAITKIILTGGGAMLPGLKELIAKEVGVEIVFAAPFEKTKAPAFLTPMLSEAGPSFAISTGCALKAFL